MCSFKQMSLSKEVLKALDEEGFKAPTPIQLQCIPQAMDSLDLIGQAQTGTGKTAAFGIPIIEKLDIANKNVQAIILTPTRELALQVTNDLVSLSKYKKLSILPVYGGQNIVLQIQKLKKGVQLVVGTPGRVLDHLKRRTIRTSDVTCFVLDEADEMLDMGFIDDIVTILRQLPSERQMLLFSATMPVAIRNIAQRYMHKPKYISVNRGEVTIPKIEQLYYRVPSAGLKMNALCKLVEHEQISLGIIFCRTKKNVDDLAEALQRRGYLASGLHGDLLQKQRDRVMNSFRQEKTTLLIATDVASRGLDVEGISHVINFDIPQESESYVHRIGRTGRAGKTGKALTLVTPQEMRRLKQIEKELSLKIKAAVLPTLEDVAQKQKSYWQNKVREFLANNKQKKFFKEVVESLSKDYTGEEIASAVLQLTFSEKFGTVFSSTPEYDDTGARPGMVRFFISIGRNQKISLQDIVNAFEEQAGVAKHDIGRINVYDRFVFVEVKEASALFIYEVFKRGIINGVRMRLDYAKPRKVNK
ncbi:MAG: hypothetical protein RLZ12_946 [Bacillota bacterium]|jgi:ATP-dependent RNA helicase DeaD